MRRSRRYLVVIGVALTATLVTLGISAAAPGQRGGTVVVTKGREGFEPNAQVYATLRFAPEVITVNSGDTLTWKHLDSSHDPHTITITTNRRELPHDFEGENCKVCQQADKGHFSRGKPPVPVLNKGAPGLDTRGDSLFMRPKRNATVSAVISAPAGATLYFVCIIHPWMQAKIKVT